jgi:protein-tyrosine-phosphatase
MTDSTATSAGTQPADRVHPGAVAAGRRAGLDLSTATPRHLAEVNLTNRLVVTVCDRAHEDLDPGPAWLHWSISDPVAAPSKRAFDRTVVELRDRIASLAGVAS